MLHKKIACKADKLLQIKGVLRPLEKIYISTKPITNQHASARWLETQILLTLGVDCTHYCRKKA